jgi:hypothetical protein
MTAGNSDRVDRFRAQFIGNLLKVPRIDTAQISGTLDGVEDGWSGLFQGVVFGRRHALLTLPRLNGGAEALADPTELILSPNSRFAGSAMKFLVSVNQ